MTAKILSGIELSNACRQQVATDVGHIKQQYAIDPKLVVLLIGNHIPSEIYVKHKIKACHEAGIICELIRFNDEISQSFLLDQIHKLNADKTVHGILIQLPLPSHIDVNKIIESINPLKDVDGFHPSNLGLLALGIPRLRACTPFGIIQLLKSYHIPLLSKDALMIGLSRIVGLPMTFELITEGATVTCAHRDTKNLQEKIKSHEIIIVATGHRQLIETTSFQKHHVIIDVGIHRIDDRVCGDVNFDEAVKTVKAITPVPGGVGPMTVTALLQNIVLATKMQIS